MFDRKFEELPGTTVTDEQGNTWTLNNIERGFFCLLSRETRQVSHVTSDRYNQLIQITKDL